MQSQRHHPLAPPAPGHQLIIDASIRVPLQGVLDYLPSPAVQGLCQGVSKLLGADPAAAVSILLATALEARLVGDTDTVNLSLGACLANLQVMAHARMAGVTP